MISTEADPGQGNNIEKDLLRLTKLFFSSSTFDLIQEN